MHVCTCGNWVPKNGYAERMKCLFKSKTRTPVQLVQHLHDLLIYAIQDSDVGRERKREEKMSDLSKLILDLRIVLFGNGQTEPNSDACAHVTQEFFKMDTLRLLIVCLPKLDLGARQNSTHVIANLQRQRVSGRMIASDFMEKNLDIMDILIPGYEAGDIALTYGAISRECIRHQTVAKYVLESEHMKNFFSYTQIPNFDIASDAQATFKLLTRHKSTVAQFLSNNYEWFFQEYNSQLLESPSYITRRHAVKLLGDILLDRSNSAVMLQYVSSLENMRILMNLFRESKKSIQLETFHVFKLFVANQNKPLKIVRVLVKNRKKLLQFLAELKIDKEDEQFHADKAQVMKEIAMLDLGDRSSLCGSSCADSVDFEVEP